MYNVNWLKLVFFTVVPLIFFYLIFDEDPIPMIQSISTQSLALTLAVVGQG